VPVGAEFQDGPAEEWHQRQQRLGHAVQGKGQVQVEDTVGLDGVGEQPGRTVVRFPLGNGRFAGRQVVQGQAGNGGQGLGGIRRLLEDAQGGRILGHPLALGRVHAGRRLGQGGLFGGVAIFLQPGVRGQGQADAVGIVQKILADGFLEHRLAGGQPGLEPGQRPGEAQGGEGIAVVQPGGQGPQHQGQAAREGAGVVFAQGEFHGVDPGFHGVGRQPVADQVPQGGEDQVLHGPGVLGPDALEAGGEGHLAQFVLQAAAGQVLAQPAVQQGLAQGGGRQPDQHVLQDVEDQDQIRVRRFGQQPVDGDEAAFGLARGGGEGHGGVAGRIEGRLERHGRIHGPGLEGAAIGVEQAQPFGRVVVAGKEEPGVAGMVVVPVEGHEILVGQGGDDVGIAAGIHAVGGVREEQPLGEFGQYAVRRGIDALHFVVDDAAAGKLAVRVPFVVPPLLEKDLPGDAGEEHGVKIDVDQVVEIPEIGGGHRIAGLVGIGEGVEKGVQGALQQLHERLPDGVLARAAQHRMLQDVGHAGGGFGRRAEGDAEDLVGVVLDQGEQLGAGAGVTVQDGPGGVFVEGLVPEDIESVDTGHHISNALALRSDGKITDRMVPRVPGLFQRDRRPDGGSGPSRRGKYRASSCTAW